jgi:hypothetical protein
MLISRSVIPPAGTFLAKVRDGAIQFPPPLKRYCDASEWTLFRVVQHGDDRLEIRPIAPEEDTDITADFHSSLTADGRLWIPAALRHLVSLGEQSVMMRVENEGIGIYLRKVFETLGFGP